MAPKKKAKPNRSRKSRSSNAALQFTALLLFHVSQVYLVEEDVVLVLVVHPLDVPQHIFLGYDPEQATVVRDQRLAEAELLKHVHHRLHRRLIRDGHGRQIHDPVEIIGFTIEKDFKEEEFNTRF